MILLIVGRTKIPYNELFHLSRKELNVIIKGHEIDKREDVENLRYHAHLTMSPHVTRADQSKIDPRRMWPLPWDKNVDLKPNTEKVRKLIDIYKSGKIIVKDGES